MKAREGYSLRLPVELPWRLSYASVKEVGFYLPNGAKLIGSASDAMSAVACYSGSALERCKWPKHLKHLAEEIMAKSVREGAW